MEPSARLHERLSGIYSSIVPQKEKCDLRVLPKTEPSQDSVSDPITGGHLNFTQHSELGHALVVRDQNRHLGVQQFPASKTHWLIRSFFTFLLLLMMVPYHKLLSSSYGNTLVDYLQVCSHAIPLTIRI
jgi:hypothetical protein